ncbi:phosphotransferase family protein [Nocardia sp. CA2R105]|uniref:phosphotransferase family protein n=1 Tax=Nocardia coffeae TaxID=2873381 RepID=UPI001CA76C17|nr:phosphotransferase family protein [Nocardia coffeae]MBY8863763.1 phosphotransferase family protein [Nocardia coffeae]
MPAVAATEWLSRSIPELQPPLQFAPIGGGHSNITVLVTDAVQHRVVLRRPPLGSLPRGSHDVLREARTMAAVSAGGIPAPRILATCDDPEVIGAVFVVAEFVDGVVVENPADVERHLPETAQRRRAADDLVERLAALHTLDPQAAGLADLVRAGTFLERQLRRFAAIWSSDHSRELPLIDELHSRLAAAMPRERHRAIVHSDYRLANTMVQPSGEISAVLDWELAAVGDPLADLAFFLNNWEEPDGAAARVWMETPPTCAGGFPDRGQMVERYAQLTGFDIDDLEYYRAFSWWRMAVIAEGIKNRYETGAMAKSVDMVHVVSRVEWLAELAHQHLRAHGA